MILQQLGLRNFGLFRGQQTFDLSPGRRNGRTRPIVLFGGINGGGKTTLFDAVQLALYGPRARCSKRSSLGYEDFLRESIHHGVPPEQGAAVTLAFQYTTDGEPHEYEVRRSWQVQEAKVRETLVVLQDRLPSQNLARTWPQLVEELIPLEISQLFFFDGEKIRALAEDGTSSAALGAAIKALLGLDLVERLIADATVVQGRLEKQTGTPQQRAETAALEERFRDLQSQLQNAQAERAALENRRLRVVSEAQEAEERFATTGGRHWNERQQREERLKELGGRAGDLETRLVSLAAGELPLALVPDLLSDAADQDRRELLAAEAEVVARLLAERDKELVAALRSAKLDPAALRLVSEHLAQDRQARQAEAPPVRRLELSQGGRSLLHHLCDRRLGELRAEAQSLLETLAAVQQEREDLDRALAATPAEVDIRPVVERFKEATRNLALLEEEAGRLKEVIEARKADLKEAEQKLRRVWEANVTEEFKHEDWRRMIDLAGQTRATMQEFLRRATGRKIDRLSALITESFRYLVRKKTLVERILIDPASFAVTLFDAAGHALPRQRLSEGEKQIFAIAMLWGLARASARPLPAVIDTPMARLDVTHRHHLVERYFPSASHQVVVLSTDTEVDRHYYQLLQPAIARAYHLRYDEQTRATVGEEGYFWKEAAGDNAT
jgi:DNA sulfur modification protein DndD